MAQRKIATDRQAATANLVRVVRWQQSWLGAVIALYSHCQAHSGSFLPKRSSLL